jgi:hypothetical protein
MKKLIVIVASLLVAVSAHAQLGVVAGITSSKSDLKSAMEDVKNISLYHVGLTYKLDLGLLAIQPSILYNMKGSKFDMLSKETTLDNFEYKTGYLEIPVQVQAGLDLGLARVYGFLEPFVGYAVSNSIAYSQGQPKQTWDNIKSKMEYGVGLGAGVELIKHVQVSVRYFWNMGLVYNGKNINIGDVASPIAGQKCNGISASVALLF